MATMMNNLNNLIPVNLVPDSDRLAVAEDNVLYIHMLRAKLESDLSDMDMDFEDAESVSVRTGRNLSRKERARRHRKANRTHKTRDRYHGKRGKEWRYNEYADHETGVYLRRLNGDWNIRGRRLEKTGRPQRVNIHFTDGARLDVVDLSEADVAQTWSVNSYDLPIGDFFQYMDDMDWKRIPTEVRFSVDWNAENPFACGYPEPEYFEMTATLRRTQKTVSAEKAKEEYLKFKKEYQVFQKYGENLRALREEMYAELRG